MSFGIGVYRRVPRAGDAYHEGAHAVLSAALGLSMDQVTIVPGPDYDGCVRFSAPREGAAGPAEADVDRSPEIAVTVYMVAAAGAIGEGLAMGHARGLEGLDQQHAMGRFDAIHDTLGVGPAWWANHADTVAREYLKRQWGAVELVTRALLVERTIDGDRILELAGDVEPIEIGPVVGSIKFAAWRAARYREPERTIA